MEEVRLNESKPINLQPSICYCFVSAIDCCNSEKNLKVTVSTESVVYVTLLQILFWQNAHKSNFMRIGDLTGLIRGLFLHSIWEEAYAAGDEIWRLCNITF